MKTIAALLLFVVFTSAEPPPSSYLPPPSSNRGTGYSEGPTNQNFGAGPQIVAARNLEGPRGHAGVGAHGGKGGHGSRVNAFGRSASQEHDSGAHAYSGGEESAGYGYNNPAFARNALDEINSEPANYNFGYTVNDDYEGTDFGHHEERQEEHAQGEYHVVLPDGRKQTVSYEADERGFKPQISYEDSEDLAHSGYDSNANNVRSNQDSGYGNHAGHGNSNNGYGYHGNRDSGYSSSRDSGYPSSRGSGSSSNHGNSYSSNGYSDNGYDNGNPRSNGY